jgi:hypothetical protein
MSKPTVPSARRASYKERIERQVRKEIESVTNKFKGWLDLEIEKKQKEGI